MKIAVLLEVHKPLPTGKTRFLDKTREFFICVELKDEYTNKAKASRLFPSPEATQLTRHCQNARNVRVAAKAEVGRPSGNMIA